jgi:RHS repeat-associated protein
LIANAARAVVESLERRVFLNASPTATLDSGNPSPVNLGDTIQVNLEANVDFGDTIDGWVVNFGDGSTPDELAAASSTSDTHSYSHDGPYTITANVLEHQGTGVDGDNDFDDDGTGVGCSTVVTVVDPNYSAPTVNLTPSGSPTAWATPATLDLSATYSGGDSDYHVVNQFTIDWGDGTVENLGPTSSNAGEYNHTYHSAGSFDVTASATDEVGTSSTFGPTTIIVGATPVTPPSLTISNATAVAASVGWPVTVNGVATYSAHDPDQGSLVSFLVNWGDGNTETITTGISGNSGVLHHTYTSAGTFSITATTTDNYSTPQTSPTSNTLSMVVNPATPEAPGGNGDGNGADLFNGAVMTGIDGPSSGAFGLGFGAGASWSNNSGSQVAGGVNGNLTLESSLPLLAREGSNTLALENGGSVLWFDNNSGWVERYGGTDSLTYDSGNTQYVYVPGDGSITTFYDFSHGGLSGKIKNMTDADGNPNTYTYNGSSQLTNVDRSNITGTVHTCEDFAYAYSTGRVTSITYGQKHWDTGLSQSDPGTYTTIRKTVYTYYGSGVTGGTAGDLELAQTEDVSSNVLDTQYFRYYISGDADTNGYVGALKYVLNSESYTRLAESLTGGTTPLTATDAQVKPLADEYFQYDSTSHKVTETLVQGSGSSAASTDPGEGTTTYSYDVSGNSPSSYNTWTNKTTVSDPSGTTSTTYFNSYGEVMLTVVSDGSDLWGTFNHYDSSGRVDYTASPSAVSIPDLATIEFYSDLLHSSGGNYQYLNDSTGLINKTSYYSSTTANSGTAGGINLYVSDTYLKHGETGTDVHQSHTTYFAFTAGTDTYNPVAVSTSYSDDAGSNARSTTYAYTMYTSTVQPKLQTVTLPNISGAQNGSNSADSSSTFFDIYGRTIWTKDADGHVNYSAYDQATGATIKTITDVVYASLSGDEQTSFGLTGWSNPSGGLHLVTTYAVDTQGRTTKTTTPGGVVSYTAYNDTGYETRSYSGWQSASGTATSNGSTTTLVCTGLTGGTGSYIGQTLLITAGTDSGQQKLVSGWNASTHTLTVSSAFSSATTTSSVFIVAGQTGPISISREYRAAANSTYFSYSESLSIAVAAHLSSTGEPDGTETFSTSDITSLTRSFSNDAGQAIYSDQYFDMTGATYSQTVANSSGVPTDFGTAGTNFYRTSTGYDINGRQNRSVSPTGTITRTVYDALGRTASTWVGTTDTHSGSEWTPGTNTGNMMKIAENQYDGGGMGDGNLTQVTTRVDTSSGDDRVTQYLYDWRDRRMLEKDGVQSTETDGAHRPIIYTIYDNAGEVLETDCYDGDGVTPSSTSGVPNAPSSSLLRAKSTSSYDDQGRVFESKVYSVDQSNGTVGNALTTDTFYDHRGETIAVFSPGGQVSKTVYDGAGRVTTSYITDGGAVNNSGSQQIDWTHAGSVSSDVVLTQTDTTYDADGNVVMTATHERFHDNSSSSEGALGTPTSGIHARVSYVTNYYDAADRPTDSVNVGTNGGSSYTRPGTVPADSDTVLVEHTDYNNAGEGYLSTDPRGILNESFYDLMGRTTKAINGTTLANLATGAQITQYTYDGAGHQLTMTAKVSGANDQVTAYIYGVGGTSGTNLFSNDLILKTEYPDPSTGAASTSSANDVSNTYDLLGERLTMTDQNGSVHTYTYDVLGRQTSDTVTTLGSGVDGSVRRHDTSYDTGGRPYQMTSYSNTSGTTIVNQVQFGYNGFGQETIEYQDHTSGGVSAGSFNIQYSYANGSGNNNRLISMTYPNGRILDYDYSATQSPVSGISSTTTTATVTTIVAHGLSIGDKVWIQGGGSHYDGSVTVASVPTSTTFTYTIASFTGSSSGTDITEAKLSIDEAISRMDGLQDRAGTSAGTILEAYSYLGLGTIVERTRAENHTKLTYVQQSGDTLYSGDGGDQYTGLDRFGRVIDQFWIDTSGPTTTDRIQYGYDRDGNVLYEKNDVNGTFSEVFHANGAASGDDETAYDALGRLTAYRRGTLSSSGHNGSGLDTVSSLNTTFPGFESQSWALDDVGNWSTLSTDGAAAVTNSFNSRNEQTAQGGSSLTYDNDGNTLVDQNGKHYLWDAWNRLITEYDTNGTTVLLAFVYDAMGRDVKYTNDSGTANRYYDNQGRLMEGIYSSIYAQYVYGLDYTNDLILRDHNSTTGGNYGLSSSGLDERLYVQHDANWDVTSVIDTSASVKERIIYTPYGEPKTLDGSWASYDDSSTYQWTFKFQGARWESLGHFSYMGARPLNTQTGRWMSADPSGYSDGANLYNVLKNDPIAQVDPAGLWAMNFNGDSLNKNGAMRQKIRASIARVAARCKIVAKQADDLAKVCGTWLNVTMGGHWACQDAVGQLFWDLQGVSGICSEIAYGATHPNDEEAGCLLIVNFYDKMLPGGATGPDAVTVYEASTITMNDAHKPPWYLWADQKIDEVLMHECSHLYDTLDTGFRTRANDAYMYGDLSDHDIKDSQIVALDVAAGRSNFKADLPGTNCAAFDNFLKANGILPHSRF